MAAPRWTLWPISRVSRCFIAIFSSTWTLDSRHCFATAEGSDLIAVTAFSHIRHAGETLNRYKELVWQVSPTASPRKYPHSQVQIGIPSPTFQREVCMKTIEGRFRAAMLMGAAVSVLAFATGAEAQNQDSTTNQWTALKGWSSGNWVPNGKPWPYNEVQHVPVLAVVGDVACQPGEEESGEKAGENCSGDTVQNLTLTQAATAQQIENMKPDRVALVGDEQYQVAQYSDFENSYETTYGGFKSITRPAPGNHEFYVEHGAIGVAGYGYFSYFNGVQHNTDGTQMTATISGNPDTGGTFTQPVPFSDGQAGHFEQTGGLGTNETGGPVGVGDGWYSYNLGSWHIISLNIECETQPGGCVDSGAWFAAGLEWLKKDLEANDS